MTSKFLNFLVLLLTLTALNSFASSKIKVMNFNTMCDTCNKKGYKKKFGSFKQRLKGIADTINRHDPDLISLQEFRTRRQVDKRLKRLLKTDYHIIFARGSILSYADPVLMVRKSRYEVTKTIGFWLGRRNGRFSFGFKGIKIPRRVQLAFLKDKVTNLEFIFVGTHFDNSHANKFASAKYLNNYLKKYDLPILFAGDTNIKTSMVGYDDLLNGLFTDTFQGVPQTIFYANAPYTIHDACNPKKAPTFPECRIDHVLISENAPWSVKSWGIDVFRYYGTVGFSSDHRAVIVNLE